MELRFYDKIFGIRKFMK